MIRSGAQSRFSKLRHTNILFFLAYFPYFETIKTGLSDHHVVCVFCISSHMNFRTNEPVLMKKLRGLVRQRTIPTERPPLVGEVSANFS
jgi:hypothetical protein